MSKRKKRKDDWTAWIAIRALTKGICPHCGWALKRDAEEPYFRGCPFCGLVFREGFDKELIPWEGEDDQPSSLVAG